MIKKDLGRIDNGGVNIKSKGSFIFGFLLGLVSLILMIDCFKINLLLSGVFFIGFLAQVFILIHWSAVSCKWICNECRYTFKITL